MSDGVVILAAGEGARLGGVAKALLARGEGTFLSAIVNTARTAGVTDIVVVVGSPHGAAVAEAARALELRVVENPEPARGMASSVALGFAAIATSPTSVEAAYLWPVDHPGVTPATLRALANGLLGHDLAQPRYRGQGGHPPLIARCLWGGLAACTRIDGGARTVLAAADRIVIDVDDPGVVRDVDTPADLAEAR